MALGEQHVGLPLEHALLHLLLVQDHALGEVVHRPDVGVVGEVVLDWPAPEGGSLLLLSLLLSRCRSCCGWNVGKASAMSMSMYELVG